MNEAAFVNNPLPSSAPTASQRIAARVAGSLYLATMASAVFAEVFVRGSIIVPGDAVRTAQNLVASERLVRVGLVADIFTLVGVLVIAWGLYVVLKPINEELALLGAMLRVAEVAVAASALVNVLDALRLVSGLSSVAGFSEEQLSTLARLALARQGFGTQLMFVLLGLGSLAFSWVLLRSSYIPRALAILGVVGSSLLASGSLILLVFHQYMAQVGLSYMLPLGVFEVSLGALFAFRGLPNTGAGKG